MFPFRARVLTRNGTKGTIVRQLTDQPPLQYLVASVDGRNLIVFQDDLRLAVDEDWTMNIEGVWNGVERRKGNRRQRERRGDEQQRAQEPGPERRMTERRHAERRWIVPKGE